MRISNKVLILPALCFAIVACGSEPAGATKLGDSNSDGSTSVAMAQRSEAQAAVKPTTLPATALAAWEQHARNYCLQVQERFVAKRFERFTGRSPGFTKSGYGFIPADFNGDAVMDFIVFTPNSGCAEEAGSRDYGSRGGPPTDFIISSASGYRVHEGFGGWVDESMVKRVGKQDILQFNHGQNGDCGFIATASWGWSNGKISIVERRNDKGQLVDQSGCLLRAKPGGQERVASSQAPVGPLGLVSGHYVKEGDDCRRPIGVLYYDGSRYGDIYEDEYYVGPIGKVTGRGGKFYLSKFETELTVISPTRIQRTIQDTGSPERWCPAEAIPRALRGDLRR